MTLTFVLTSLSGGGVERVAAYMANYWARQGWQINIVTICHGRKPPAYHLNPAIVHRDLDYYDRVAMGAAAAGDMGGLARLMKECSEPERELLRAEQALIAALRAEIVVSGADVVIAFMDVNNVRTLAATYGLAVPVIVSEHSDPYMNRFSEAREMLRRRLYPRARYVVTLTREVLEFLAPIAGARARVIPNAVEPPAVKGTRNFRRAPEGLVMSMGRLSHEKGFPLLLEAFATVASSYPEWRLEIWGEGPLREMLVGLAGELGLCGRASFPGFTTQPHEVMRHADLFVVSSLCEGWSNVLAEAMACGLPVVSFDCPSGPRNIIRSGVDGLLVPAQNVQKMGAALAALMGNRAERERLARRAPEVLERFSIDKVMGMWDETVTAAAGV